jgi:hypothetical protein
VSTWGARYFVDDDEGGEEAWLMPTGIGSWTSTPRIQARHHFASQAEAVSAIEAYGGLVGGDWDAVELDAAAPIEKAQPPTNDALRSAYESALEDVPVTITARGRSCSALDEAVVRLWCTGWFGAVEDARDQERLDTMVAECMHLIRSTQKGGSDGEG